MQFLVRLSLLSVGLALAAVSSAGVAHGDTLFPMIMSVKPVAIERGKTTVCEISILREYAGIHKVEQAHLERAEHVFVSGSGVTGRVLPIEPPPAPPAVTVAAAIPAKPATPAAPAKSPEPAAPAKIVAPAKPAAPPTTATVPKIEAPKVEATAPVTPKPEASKSGTPQAETAKAAPAPADKVASTGEKAGAAPAANVTAKPAAVAPAAGVTAAAKPPAAATAANITAKPQAVPAAVAVPLAKTVAKVEPAKPAAAAPAKPAAPKRPPYECQIEFTVSADAELGPRQFRFVGPSGASTVAEVVIAADPVTMESKDNETLETAQSVTLPATLCGGIEKPEDIDHFRFTAKEGSQWVFRVYASRLEDRIYQCMEHVDPLLTLRDAHGAVLATCDNTFGADPMLAFRMPIDGAYDLEIRDVRYKGDRDWNYAIEASQRPLVETVFPPMLVPGERAVCQATGPNLPEPQFRLDVPEIAPDGIRWFTPHFGAAVANRLPLLVSRLPRIMEIDRANDQPAAAQAIAVPAAVCGRIEKEEDVDCYQFEATAGEPVSVEVIARRLDSSLDANVRILDASGKTVAQNDDASFDRMECHDSRIDGWIPKADGVYTLEVTDVNLQGGPAAFYCVLVTPGRPGFILDIDGDKTLLGPGASAPIMVRAVRRCGFDGAISLAVDGLPPGVTAACGQIRPGMQDGCIIVTAAPDAKLAVSNITVRGTATLDLGEGKRKTLVATATPLQEIYMPGGGRGTYPVDVHTLTVNEPVDVRQVQLDKSEITLKPGESAAVQVTLVRRDGYDQGVSIDAINHHLEQVLHCCMPPGLTVDEAKSRLLMSGKETHGSIVFTAAEDAKPFDRQLVPVLAHISLTFVAKYTLAGSPLWISVRQ